MTTQEWIEKVAEYEAEAKRSRSIFQGQSSRFMREGAQHLAAALEEITRLRAEAERVVVPESPTIVPDPTDEDMESIAQMMADVGAGHFCAEESGFQAIARTAWVCCQAYSVDWLRVHSVPASRVLKDGEVAVSEAELAELRTLETCERLRNEFNKGRTGYIGIGGSVACLARLDALRAQGKEGAT